MKLVKRHQKIFQWKSLPIDEDPHVVAISAANVDRVSQIRSEDLQPHFTNFLDQGRRGVFFMIDQQAVGHAWITTTAPIARTVEGYFQLPPLTALIHYCYVKPDYRGRGIFQAMLQQLAATTPDQVIVLVDTSATNAASRRGIERAGFEEIGQGDYWQIGSKLIFRRQTLSYR